MQAVFIDFEYHLKASHFAFAFTTKTISGLFSCFARWIKSQNYLSLQQNKSTDPKFQNPNREMMEQKSIKNFKKLVADFRALTTKDNQNKTKNLKETNLETITRVERQTKLQLLRIERLIAISSLTKKNRNLLAEQRKQKRRYHGVYSDDGVESGDKFSKSDNEEIFKKKTNAQTEKRTVAKTKTEPAMNLKKQNKTVHCN